MNARRLTAALQCAAILCFAVCGVTIPAGASFQSRGAGQTPAGVVRASDSDSAEKVALGEALFFDRRLSADGNVSCATCHDPANAFAHPGVVATGVGGRVGVRNVPTLLNVKFSRQYFWDGRASTLEEQARQPLLNPSEMGMVSAEAVAAKVAADPSYRRRFRRVFRREGISLDTIATAIAAFERTLVSDNSPFDRFIAGDRAALTESQRRGWELFGGKALCATCHTFTPASPFFTDFKFHNTGVATRGKDFEQLAARAASLGGPRAAGAAELADLGRYLVTGQPRDLGAFKTPTLRDVELTAPYMHDGSEKTLLDVVRFYNRGGEPNSHLDPGLRPLGLNEGEVNDLVEFLRALTSDEVLRRTQTTRPQASARPPAL